MKFFARFYTHSRTTLLILIITLGVTACDNNDLDDPVDEFPNELYSLDFEGANFAGGNLVGQDEWFAVFGAEAATIVSSDVREPKVGSQSLQVDGSLLDEFQGFHFGSYARPLNYAPLSNGHVAGCY